MAIWGLKRQNLENLSELWSGNIRRCLMLGNFWFWTFWSKSHLKQTRFQFPDIPWTALKHHSWPPANSPTRSQLQTSKIWLESSLKGEQNLSLTLCLILCVWWAIRAQTWSDSMPTPGHGRWDNLGPNPLYGRQASTCWAMVLNIMASHPLHVGHDVGILTVSINHHGVFFRHKTTQCVTTSIPPTGPPPKSRQLCCGGGARLITSPLIWDNMKSKTRNKAHKHACPSYISVVQSLTTTWWPTWCVAVHPQSSVHMGGGCQWKCHAKFLLHVTDKVATCTPIEMNPLSTEKWNPPTL